MVFFTTMFTTADVNIHALIAKYGIDIQIVRPEMTKFKIFREFSKHEFLFCGNYILKYCSLEVKQSINRPINQELVSY